ncbi:G-type lectin S-receptor-like serine/threonine-protein kinase At2g19130 [Malania oleifera]|uniref:G-type lectin S-receptor-like serine/threonine-protein kinase At2g19130 n=1 Tax=Malania oleifera TaxID=397392 RepID=UPI0025AE2573|nr:G-type lectin S-receptor-like serine/threonine-protein kinase At2g19130 [Malania oleifera]
MGDESISCFMLYVLLLCTSLKTHFSLGANDIYLGNSLSGDQTIVSTGGEFELGFFNPGNSSNFYIGIWYKKISLQTVVWVANRDKPLFDKYSSELRILDGNLVLLNGSKNQVWSTNLDSNTSNSTEAVLLDNGNFVLRDGPNSSTTIWQSFHFPTDTWLPGSKLGLDKRNNRTQLLTSWKNSNDPGTGIFTLEHDPDASDQYIIVRNMTKQYWTSGEWNGHFFSLIPEMRSNFIYNSIQFNYSYVTNENESYFTYSYPNTSIKSRTVMDLSGQAKQLSWLETTQQWYLFWSQPRQQCAVYALCGPFGICDENIDKLCGCLPGFVPSSQKNWNLSDWSEGCKRNANLQCGNNASNSRKDQFLPRPNVRLPVNPQELQAKSFEECELACLSNCSCTAYAYHNGGCSIWMEDLFNLQQFPKDDNNGKTLFVRVAPSEFPAHSGSKEEVASIVVGSAAVVLALFSLVLVLCLWRRRSVRSTKDVEGSLLVFRYTDLLAATKNFSEKLGGGGYGSVFKGIMPDFTVVAVKKLESINQGEKQFRTEVSTIGTIQHINLIRLRGFCSEGTKKLLVYDYMPNGSLDSHLFHKKDSSKALGWNIRFQIAVGTARGLLYLHEKCRNCILHCDIKPENILLDAGFYPKVADFGLAKLVGREFSRVLTTIRGTRGYLAPEWFSGVAITAKADVYSYGMMLFELISGRRNTQPLENGNHKFFPLLAATKIAEGNDILSLLDHKLDGKVYAEELERVLKVACWCIQDDETHRPSMSQVVQILEGILDVEQPKIPRSLQMLVENSEHIDFFAESSSSQGVQESCDASAASSYAKYVTGIEF